MGKKLETTAKVLSILGVIVAGVKATVEALSKK